MNIPGYTVRKAIGKGGMATAYLAVQESLEREVVLKVLDSSNIRNSDMVERFLAEGRIVASLNHPNIITIFDIGTADDDLYISMEYVRGGDLKQRIKAGLTPDQALDYLLQLAGALRAAHEHDIIHRDIKPANILFREDGTPLLTDFGIAKQTSMDSDLTSTGMFLGSPNYVSPEQADGYAIDGRTDIYSLGCVLFEMLTGSKPFRFASVVDIVIQHKQAPVPRLPEELAEFQPLLNRMMAKQPGDRFADAGQLATAIRELQAQRWQRLEGRSARNRPGTTASSIGQHRLVRILVLLLVLSTGFFASIVYLEIRLDDSGEKIPTATTRSILTDGPALPGIPDGQASMAEVEDANREQIIEALTWLGRQSLEEFNLTYPPRDNAYYYFTRLLQLVPDSREARLGIRAIADRYAILAEQALAHGETDRSRAFVELGLKIDADNETLQALQELIRNESGGGFTDSLKSWFDPLK